MNKTLINVNSVTKIYNKKTILKDINFEIKEGTFTTLLGANGSGKSTLMRLMSGSEYTDRGEITFKGESVNSWDMIHKKDMFYINENINIETSLNMREFSGNFKNLFPRWHDEFFKQMIKDRGLNLDQSYHQYSRGQKMQFNLIIALASKPEVLLLDEITSVMDVYARRYFLGLLHRFCQEGKTVIMTTNIISELQFYTTDLLLLQNNQLKLSGKLHEVAGGFVKLKFPYGSNHPLLKRTDLHWAGVNGDGSENFLISQAQAERLNITPDIIDRREITLEDIFIFHYADVGEKRGDNVDAA
jgi:ABC-2 type transport system ATP-binding protein